MRDSHSKFDLDIWTTDVHMQKTHGDKEQNKHNTLPQLRKGWDCMIQTRDSQEQTREMS